MYILGDSYARCTSADRSDRPDTGSHIADIPIGTSKSQFTHT